MKVWLSILGAIFCLFPVLVGASASANRPLTMLFANANAVVSGRVVGVSAACDPLPALCNRMYVITLERSSVVEFKAPQQREEGYQKVCSGVPVEIGETYILFIEAPSKFNVGEHSACRQVVDVDGLFQKQGSYVYRVGSPDARIFVNFEGVKYLTNAMVEPEFQEALERLVKQVEADH